MFIDKHRDFTRFDSKCEGLAKFIYKVHLVIYCIEYKVRQKYQGDPLSYKAQKGPSCILNSFSEGSL